MKKQLNVFWLLVLYGITRVYIWFAKPVDFTQITAVYMPYAHLWASGVKPYLEQWYEYPPATIPLFYLPHLIDRLTASWGWHIDYGLAYRSMMLLVDVGLFCLIVKVLNKKAVSFPVMAGSLLFYSLATAKAHDFVYDSMDLVFIGAIVLGLASIELLKGLSGRLVEWLGYFLAVGLKLINGPLGLVYLLADRKHLKKTIPALVIAGMIIWIYPLLLFRSSLSVMLVYHSQRGLQVESVPAQIAALINRFTDSEEYVNKYQSMNIEGPVSSRVASIFTLLFAGALGGYLLWSSAVAWKTPSKHRFTVLSSLTMGYLFCFMLFAKVLSTPYHLWYIPLVAIFPFTTLKKQLYFTLPALIMIVISMTNIPNIALGRLTLHLVIGLVRTGLLIWLTGQSMVLAKESLRT